MGTQSSRELALLLANLDQAYNRKGWHGSNLRGSIRGLSARQVLWRSRPDRHSIADIVVHCAYWKYAVRRRFRGDERGSFPLKGSNWFALPKELAESDWRPYVRPLETEHRSLRQAIAKLPASELDGQTAGTHSRQTTL